MADAALRDLEQRWRRSGAVDDEARWHAARVQAGLLAPERLALAAWLGDPAAALATGQALDAATGLPVAARGPTTGPLTQDDLRAWAVGIDRFGVEAARRAAVSDAGRALAEGLREAQRTKVGSPATTMRRLARECWDAAAAWTLAPMAIHRARLASVLRAASAFDEGRLEPARLCLALLADAGGPDPESEGPADLPLDGEPRPFSLQERFELPRPGPGGPAAVATRLDASRRVILEHVAPWALGLRDPLADVVAGAPDRVEVASPCPRRWEDLAPTAEEGVRRCDQCHLDVVDLSSRTRAEVADLLARRAGEGMCVNLLRREDGRLLTRDCPEGLRERAAAVPVRRTLGMRLA